MKKKIILGALVLLAVICLANSMYVVEENDYACTVRFSRITSTTDTPGLHFKVPFLDSVKYFPKAIMLYDIPPSEVFTSDKQNMTVDNYGNTAQKRVTDTAKCDIINLWINK